MRIRPHGPDAKATLANIGQMQAVPTMLSPRRLVHGCGEQEFVPIVRREREKGVWCWQSFPQNKMQRRSSLP